MKIALIGASGFIGQHILQEAISRQHQVTALVRDTSKIPQHASVSTKTLDSHNSAAVTAASWLARTDALSVVSSAGVI